MSLRLVVALGSAVVAGCVVLVLLQSEPRAAGSNSVRLYGPAVELKRGEPHCQPGETVPKDTAALELLVGTFGRPLPRLRVSAVKPDGAVLTSGKPAAGSHEGFIRIPMRPVTATTQGLRVCIEMLTSGRTVLYGEPGNGLVRLDWMRPGSESWVSLAPAVAHRFALGKASLFGSLWIVVAALLVLCSAALGLWLVLRETATPA